MPTASEPGEWDEKEEIRLVSRPEMRRAEIDRRLDHYRIIRAFLVEEAKIVKAVLASQKQKK